MRTDVQEQLVRRYLLGDLPGAEATALEEEFFADDEQFERVWEIENTLVDGYVRGRLSPADRERFERHYLASPVHRRRVAFARSLIEQADGARAKAAPQPSWRERLFGRLNLTPPAWQFALTAAAALLLAAGSLWLFLDRTRLRREVAQLESESAARQEREREMAGQIAAARGESERLSSEIESLRAERAAPTPRNTPPAPAASPATARPPRPSVFSFVLSPTLVRGGGGPQELTIPAKTDVVRLRVSAVGESARRFQVSVRTVEGRQVWGPQTVRPRRGSSVVNADVPADSLAQGDYILTLSAAGPAGEPEEINRYFFRVTRQ